MKTNHHNGKQTLQNNLAGKAVELLLLIMLM